MNRMLTWGVAVVVIAASLCMQPAKVSAEEPYEGYIWNTAGRAVHSINGYVYDGSIEGYQLESGAFNTPEDIYIAPDDSIYVVDTGNNRVVQLDTNHQVVNIYGDHEGEGKLNGPKGVFVKEDGTVYVADTKNQRVVLFNKDGQFIKALNAPESPLLGQNFSYSPSKLIVDKRDYMYVVSEGTTLGFMQIDPNGDFKGFYGANDVGFSLKRFITRWIATEEQQAKLESTLPLAFTNLTQDSDGFIYTTTQGTDINQIKRLSPVGVDTLNHEEKMYGDLANFGVYLDVSSFIDVTVDEQGIITALNLQTSKMYQYDKLGNLLFVFGGIGEQNGLFVTPSSLDQNSDGLMYVIDKGRNRIDLFRKTPFATLVHEASSLYVNGQYEEAKNLWEQVITLNGNYDIAYKAIGKALYKSEQYKEAMTYFKLANARSDYSEAFREYRVEFTREHFGWIFGGILFLFVCFRIGIPVTRKWIKRKKENEAKAVEGEENVS
ncbi:NHL repeat-containing protein [Aureibacillus halotolerans]|uniref:NHL repeat-containing protein n=2 Tax=Aureibacillus halotolerans TaxID=1508390 RepID=A0A4R6U5K9_9BACI|nr:NHL repeat-containing protein [Aureibacillus halotolerans]